VLGKVLGRPSDAALTSLARADRPAPPIPVPTAAELGVMDHLGDGRAAFADGRHGEALHAFGAHVESFPEDPWGWHGRGDALQLLGSHADALGAYDAAAARSPRTGLHHAGRANALRSLGRTDEADDAARQALRLDPGLTWLGRDTDADP
jgi:tetratricopeptide (TPR) repeat protein